MHLKGTEHSRQTQFITVTDQMLSASPCCHSLKCHVSLTSCEQVSCCPDKPQVIPATHSNSYLSWTLLCFVKEFKNCWLHFLPPFPTDHLVWFIVSVDVIALGEKGLASNDAKKKKKVSFLQHMHLQWNDLYYPHMCLLLLGPSFILRGLFCTSRSKQLNNKGYRTCLSRIYDTVVTQIHM